ncbi:hypothetical protein VNO77_39924 [Canavalia gladiata]|uniref:Uncharacterized protein n=1 Tax=Canavalia gladiata TaxID=3824 RepID=A0AAN9PRN2_CANGL
MSNWKPHLKARNSANSGPAFLVIAWHADRVTQRPSVLQFVLGSLVGRLSSDKYDHFVLSKYLSIASTLFSRHSHLALTTSSPTIPRNSCHLTAPNLKGS